MAVFGKLGATARTAIGFYRLMACMVEQRPQEIAIRLGVCVGIAAARTLVRLLAGALFGVSPDGPAAVFSVSLVLSAVALLAVWIPASRASRLSPVDSRRYEYRFREIKGQTLSTGHGDL